MLGILAALLVQPHAIRRSERASRPLSAVEVGVVCRNPIGSDHILTLVQRFCGWSIPHDATPSDWADGLSAAEELARANFVFQHDSVRISLPGDSSKGTFAESVPSGGYVGSPGSSPSFASAVLWGTTDFILERAQVQFQTWVLPRIEKRVCENDSLFIPSNTCAVLKDTAVAWTSRSGGLLGALGTAARADYESVPARLETFLARELDSNGADSILRDAVTILPHLVKTVLDAGDLQQGLSDVRTSLPNKYNDLVEWLVHLDFRQGADLALKTYILDLAIEGKDVPDAIKSRVNQAVRYGRAIENIRIVVATAALPNTGNDVELRRTRRIAIVEATWNAALAVLNVAVDTSSPFMSHLTPLHSIAVGIAGNDYGMALSGISLLVQDTLVERALGLKAADRSRAFLLIDRLALVADLAQSPSPEAVRTALESYAAPAATFQTKRQRAGVITINSYLGLGLGSESVRTQGSAHWESGGLAAGASLPIGIEIDGKGVGCLVSLLDLGALASWRLSGDKNVSQSPQIGLQQVFSPGAYLLWHFPTLPLTVGAGINLSPKLRSVTAGSGTESAPARRIGLFLAIDVPLFTLHSPGPEPAPATGGTIQVH